MYPPGYLSFLNVDRNSQPELAFRRFFERYQHRLALLAHYRLGPSLRADLDADDVVQGTFLAASRDLAGFEYRSPGSFYRWLSAIASHVIEDAARPAGRLKRDGGGRATRSARQHISRMNKKTARARWTFASAFALAPAIRRHAAAVPG